MSLAVGVKAFRPQVQRPLRVGLFTLLFHSLPARRWLFPSTIPRSPGFFSPHDRTENNRVADFCRGRRGVGQEGCGGSGNVPLLPECDDDDLRNYGRVGEGDEAEGIQNSGRLVFVLNFFFFFLRGYAGADWVCSFSHAVSVV